MNDATLIAVAKTASADNPYGSLAEITARFEAGLEGMTPYANQLPHLRELLTRLYKADRKAYKLSLLEAAYGPAA